MTSPAPRFIAIAYGRYSSLSRLPRAVPDAQTLADSLQSGHQFQPVVLGDYPRGALLDAIETELATNSLPDGTLIVSWTGHGGIGGDRSLRLMGYSGSGDVEVASAGILGEWAARTGARQVLVLLDTCYSGAGVVDAARLALGVTGGRADFGRTWFGVVAASLPDEESLSGALSRHMLRLVTQGPLRPDFRWDRSRPFISGTDLINALVTDWSESRHTPFPMTFGRPWDLIRNPLFEPGVPDQPVEHLLLAARGGSGDESFFTGREAEIARIAAWMHRRVPGMLIITGPPGSGKSAVAGRIVSLSSPTERARLLQSGPISEELDPGELSVDAQLHARGVTIDTAAEELSRQLRLDPGAGPFGILAESRRRRMGGDPLVVVIDGLDEARGFSSQLALGLLVPLAREALVIAATRDVPVGNQTLIQQLGPAEVLDLGTVETATQRDVRNYVIHRLKGISSVMEPALVAQELTSAVKSGSEAPFLLARLVTSQLREHPVDTSKDGWQLLLATTVESALELDLQGNVLEMGGQSDLAGMRDMMRALALAQGGGFPAEDVWPAVATAISESDVQYTREHAFTVLGAMGRHIIAGSEGDQPVYRIAHQKLVDYMQSDLDRYARSHGRLNIEEGVARAVFDSYNELLDLGMRPDQHPYLWRYAWLHLVQAGSAGLALLRRLADRDPESFLPDLATGLEFLTSVALLTGTISESLPLAEEVVELRRRSPDRLKLVMALHGLALARSAVGDTEGADDAATEASSLAQASLDQPGGPEALRAALRARAITQFREGNLQAALRLAREAITLLQAAPADDDPWAETVSIHTLAANCLMLLSNTAAAEEHCLEAINLASAHEDERLGKDLLTDTLSTLTVVQFVQSFSPSVIRVGAPMNTAAADRLLRQYRADGPQGTVRDIQIARGMMFLVRSQLLDHARGLTVRADAEPPSALVDEALELTRPLADRILDATLVHAGLLQLRATLKDLEQQGSGDTDRDAAEKALRPFAAEGGMAALELGVLLCDRGHRNFPDVTSGVPGNLSELMKREEEAIGLLQNTTSWTHRRNLAGSLTRLADMSAMMRQNDRASVLREQAIAVWQSLLGSFEEGPFQLLSLISDHISTLVERRTAEAVDWGRQAFELIRQYPELDPLPVTGLTMLNISAAQMAMGTTEGLRDLLAGAITRLEHHQETIYGLGLATAYTNLSQVEFDAGDYPKAHVAAERAVDLFRRIGTHPLVVLNRPRASLILGRTLRKVGQVEVGTALLRQVLEELRASLVDNQVSPEFFAGMLNMAGDDLWDEFMELLKERSDLTRLMPVFRRRPREQVDLTVRTLIDSLATAPPAEIRVIRSSARAHRELDTSNFDAAWRRNDGGLPDWLTIEPVREALMVGWWNASSWAQSMEYLKAHPALLDAGTEIILEEFRLEEGNPDRIDILLEVLHGARTSGPETAYERILAWADINEWTDSEDPEEYLAQHSALFRSQVFAELTTAAEEGDQTAATYLGLLLLAQRGEGAMAFHAFRQPGSAVPSLQAAWRSRDITRLNALATIVLHRAEDPATRRSAAIGLAIARVLEKGDTDVTPLLDSALEDSTEDDRGRLTGLVADAIMCHPGAAGSLARLLEQLSEG